MIVKDEIFGLVAVQPLDVTFLDKIQLEEEFVAESQSVHSDNNADFIIHRRYRRFR
jgi:hypothetical protein